MTGPVLILGGTAEGRRLGEALRRVGVPNVYSLAGRTDNPVTVGEVRTGGFGGVDGLIGFLRDGGISAVVDATHPFAVAMSRNAVQACRSAGVRLIRLERPSWGSHVDAPRWDWVDDHAAAAAAVRGARVLLTVGRQHTLDYSPALDDRFVLARVAEPPDASLPEGWELLAVKGPFTLEGERDLFRRNRIDALVTKDSGGSHTSAKLLVAAEVGAQVVVVRRAPQEPGVETAASVEEALSLLAVED